MLENRAEVIVENKELNQKIVYSINKAIVQDVPFDIREHHLETNNRNIFATGDHINENLRRYVVKDGIELLPFKRSAWEGRIIIDKSNKVTYSVSTRRTLDAVIKNHGDNPHYLRSILYAENSDCQSSPKQITISDVNPEYLTDDYDEKLLEEDYNRIMKGAIGLNEDYKHYIVVYNSEHHMISSIELLLFDEKFNVVDRIDLMEYVTSDFSLVEDNMFENIDAEDNEKHKSNSDLIGIKEGVKPSLKESKKEA